MLTNIDHYNKRNERWYDVFLIDEKVQPYQYCKHFENLISILNEIYVNKTVFCKKLKDKKWTVRVYINADNQYASVLSDIISQIFYDANVFTYQSTLRNAKELDIKNRLMEEYNKPLDNVLCIEGDFFTLFKCLGFKEIQYEDMGYPTMFWDSYIKQMVLPLLKYNKESVSFEVDLKHMEIVLDLIESVYNHKIPINRELSISINSENNTAVFSFDIINNDEIDIEELIINE